jgi:hypothetical protein
MRRDANGQVRPKSLFVDRAGSFEDGSPVELLRLAFDWLKEASPSVDGTTWLACGEDFERSLTDLHDRIHRGAGKRGGDPRRPSCDLQSGDKVRDRPGGSFGSR